MYLSLPEMTMMTITMAVSGCRCEATVDEPYVPTVHGMAPDPLLEGAQEMRSADGETRSTARLESRNDYIFLIKQETFQND